MWLLGLVFLDGQGLQPRPLYGLDAIKVSDKTIWKLWMWPSIISKYDK